MKKRQTTPETPADAAPNDESPRKPAGVTTLAEIRAQAEIRAITSAETLPLRSEVLRPGCSIQESVFAGDDDVTTEHWGVFVQDTLIAAASLYQERLPQSQDLHAWRLRGMAVNPASQGKGYGRQLLDRCLQSVAGHGGSVLWCNARTSAVGFYKAAGFEIVGSDFDIPGIGPHYVMVRSIGNSQG
jgi:predicted GNAT family N-acyltransferase